MELGLRPDDRVLVLGSSGWFGREFSALVANSSDQVTLLEVPGPSSGVGVPDSAIRNFAPTVVLNFAFLTRERVESAGPAEFAHVNQGLTSRFLAVSALPSVRCAVTVSSGAAVTEPEHPYGRLKAAEESCALDLIDSGRAVVVIRAYAVSGGHVRRPREYAFSDFILQAAEGAVHVRSERPVFRRYCAVSDVLRVALVSGTTGRSGLFETGGELVEMGELSVQVVARVNPGARVTREPLTSEVASSYHSDDVDWREWCGAVGVMPQSLTDQIDAAASVLLKG